MAGTTVTVANNGPVRISGDFVIKDAQGREFDVGAHPEFGERLANRLRVLPAVDQHRR